MAKHRVLEISFVNNRLAHPGEIVDFEGEAGHNLELLDEEKPAPKRRLSVPAGDDSSLA